MQFYDGWFDVGYGLVIVGLIISLWASWNVKSTFRRYQNDRNSRGLTGGTGGTADSGRQRSVSDSH
mgnify:CR=1 FL=1